MTAANTATNATTHAHESRRTKTRFNTGLPNLEATKVASRYRHHHIDIKAYADVETSDYLAVISTDLLMLAYRGPDHLPGRPVAEHADEVDEVLRVTTTPPVA